MKTQTNCRHSYRYVPQRIAILFTLMHITAGMALYAQTKKTNNDTRCGYTKEVMQTLDSEVKLKIDSLKKANKLHFSSGEKQKTTGINKEPSALEPYVFKWPLANATYRDFPSWHITNFVDHNPVSILDDTDGDGKDDNARNPNEIGDYNCGLRTYDGHTGIDIAIGPYSWKAKNDESVHVIAAEAGTIVEKHQGEFDENCGGLGSDSTCHISPLNRGNYVVVLLDDGSTATYYMHMKNGSLTTKNIGDFVRKGEYLGSVASAGCSTGPHLHFEVHLFYTNEYIPGDVIETFNNGSCAWNYTWAAVWEKEPPYNDPAVLTLETHSKQPNYGYSSVCDKTISLYYKNAFQANQKIWLRSMFRDWVDGSVVTQEVYDPFGTKQLSFIETNPDTTDRVFIPTDHSFTPAANLVGTWRYTVTFGGTTYDHYFTLNCLPAYNLSGAVSSHKGYMCSDSIASTQTITGSSKNYIQYMADGHVTLKPGFRATSGCRFVANTEGCSNSVSNFSNAEQTESKSAVAQPLKNNNDIKPQLNIYPNPSKGLFTVQYNSKEKFKASVSVRNMMGQMVYTSALREYNGSLLEQVNISSNTKGVYLVELLVNGERKVSKILIQ